MANSPLNKFISKVKQDGLARTNRYTVLFGGVMRPGIAVSNQPLVPLDIVLLCDQVQIPGTNFNTADMRTFGEVRKAPYERLYEDVNMSFYVDTNMQVKKFFDNWMLRIQNPMTRTFNYYDNYTNDIVIEVQDLKNQSRYGIKLFEAFPKSIGAVQLDYAGKDIMKLSVNFAYKYYMVGNYLPIRDNDLSSAGFSPWNFQGDTPSQYQPIFNPTPSAVQVQNDPLNAFIGRLKNFAVGAIGSKIVTSIPGILSKR
jgi:hypothetical protein